MITLDRGVVGLAWHFGGNIGFEGAVAGGRARRKGFGAEGWNGVVSQ